MKNSLIIFVVALIFSHIAVADVYKYVASDGSVYYTDEPPNQKYTRIIRTKVIVRARDNSLEEANDISEIKSYGKEVNDISEIKSYGKIAQKFARISSGSRINKEQYNPYG